jgi:hypothetical protein
MFTAVLLMTAKKWKQSKCPPTDEQIKKMWSIKTIELYSTIQNLVIYDNIGGIGDHYVK